MTLATIRTETITAIGGRTDVNSLINDQINFAVSELATMYAFEELEGNVTTTTTAAQSAYVLPADLYVLWSVKEETRSNRSLDRKDIQLGFDSIDETKTGAPNFYSIYNKQLILYGQVPDNNSGSNYLIRLRYWKRHATLASDNDALVLPVEWERGVRLKAQAFVFGLLDMEEKQAAKQAEFDRWVTRIKLPKGAGKEKAKRAGMNFGSVR